MTPADTACALLAPQPDPVHGPDSQSVTDWLLARTSDPLLRELLEQRRAQGIARYGVELRTHDGRDTVADGVQEAVDLLGYAAKYAMEAGLLYPSAELRRVEDLVGWLAARQVQP